MNQSRLATEQVTDTGEYTTTDEYSYKCLACAHRLISALAVASTVVDLPGDPRMATTCVLRVDNMCSSDRCNVRTAPSHPYSFLLILNTAA